MTDLHPDKLEVQKQWDADPCGADTVHDQAAESLEFYRAIRKHRYEIYAPWFDRVVGFDSYRSKDILEIGVGLGSDHYRFARAGNRMFALDLSKEHLRHTEKHLHLEGLSTATHLGDAESMPFAEKTFDIVYSFGALHHTPNTQDAIDEVLRVLRPNGTAIIGLYHRYSWFFLISTLFVNGVIRGGLWRKGWRRLLSEIEFRSEACSAVPLVKVMSRGEVRRLFTRFNSLEVISCHVEPSHFSGLRPLVSWATRSQLERWLSFGGWYLVIRATKAAS